MKRSTWVYRGIAVGVLLACASASPASAGPPWISVEYPANPHDPATRGALLVVNTYHHGRLMPFTVTAVAEGIVDGKRRTVELAVARTARTGAWAVSGDLPRRGSWVIVATMTDSEARAKATLLSGVTAEGELVGTRVSHRMEGGWVVPKEASRAEIESLLRATVAMGAASERSRSASAGLALLLVFPAVLVGRRVRRGCGAAASDAA